MKNKKDIKEKIQRKIERLKKIESSKRPVDVAKLDDYCIKISKATDFIEELQEVLNLLQTVKGTTIKLVSKPTFEKQTANADFATIEYDGIFCQIMLIERYPDYRTWLIYTQPISSLWKISFVFHRKNSSSFARIFLYNI